MARGPGIPDAEAESRIRCGPPNSTRHERKGVNVTMIELLASLQARLERQDGQTMAEYGVVLGIIVLGVVVAFTALSGGISNAINNVAALFNP
jgi:Flp pilus assembly pilin Flp